MLTKEQDSKLVRTALEYFQEYILYDTTSNINNPNSPSNPTMFDLAKNIQKDLEAMGLETKLDEHCYLYSSLPANTEARFSVGFIAHLDTSADVAGANIKAQRHTYKGEDIILNAQRKEYIDGSEDPVVLSASMFPQLKQEMGLDIITTDGSTLLATDDKAGIANIMSMLRYFVENPEVKHGNIQVCFTPDEEIGRGPNLFDIEGFGADYAYTLDGCAMGEYSWENFNAAQALVTIEGLNTHPGTAKDKLINSQYIAADYISAMPKDQTPEKTEGRQGFFHLSNTLGETGQTQLRYIIRDFDQQNFQDRKKFMTDLAAKINHKHEQDLISIDISDTYYNMREKIEAHKFIVDYLTEAMREVGIEPVELPFRGGTDGAMLSHKGLPCPNIFTGGINFHSKHEYLSLRTMEKSIETVITLAQKFI